MDGTSLSAALQQAVRGISVSVNRIRWFGDPVLAVERARRGTPEEERLRERTLTQTLYSCCYTTARPVLLGELRALREVAGQGSIADLLVAANTGQGRCEPGWEVVKRAHRGRLVVRRDGLAFTVDPFQVRHRRGDEPRPGDVVDVVTPASALNKSPGYVVAHSNVPMDYDRPISRVYLNIAPDGAAVLLHGCTRALNAARHAFDLKVASNRSLYYRADVAVLYLSREHAVEALADVWHIVRRLSGWMRSDIPVCTLRLAPGVGVADDPGNGASFGMDRCAIAARGVLTAGAGAGPDDRWRGVQDAFADAGIDIERPYLNAAADDIYAGALPDRP